MIPPCRAYGLRLPFGGKFRAGAQPVGRCVGPKVSRTLLTNDEDRGSRLVDAPDRDNRTPPASPAANGASEVPDPASGLAYSVLQVLVGTRLPTGELGPDNVPAKVLAFPIRLATEALIEHSKHCTKARCPRLPAAFWRFSRMRPDAVRRTATDQIYKALWLESDHEFVGAIRKRVLREQGQIADQMSARDLFAANGLSELLESLGESGPQSLASILWASEFAAPHSEALFRMLVPLVVDVTSTTVISPASPGSPKDKTVEERLRKAVRSGKEAARSAEQAIHDAELKQRIIDKTKSELASTQAKHREAIGTIATLQGSLREVETTLEIVTRDAEKSSRTNKELRKDLSRLVQAQRGLELQRSDLAQELADTKRELDHLEIDVQIAPRDADAAWLFLREEEERIRKDRLILSGGAKTAAEHEWAAHRKLEAAFLEAYPRYRQPPPQRIRPKSHLRLLALGGSSEVGRSCYLLELGERRILVDCGIKPGTSVDAYPEIQVLDRIDALIITHAHTDHIGWIPALVRRFGKFDIYCSEGTAALLPVMLEDCRRHYLRKITALRERARFIRNADVPEEEYDETDAGEVPKLAISCPFGSEEFLPFASASITFYRAGHILGAASVLIKDESGRRVFFSGDFSSFPQLTVPAASWPDDIGEVDLLVLESTYGRSVHKPIEESRRDLVSFIQDTVANREGSVILASFALGRAQELLSLVVAAKRAGAIPPTVPVHVDGLIRQINPIYSKRAAFDVLPIELNEVSGEAERREIAFTAQRKPAIIVTTSGMMTGGPVVEYARQLLPDSRHRIVFAGYQDEGAPSRALIDLDRAGRGSRVVELLDEGGELIRFEAALPAKHVGLSSHADQPGLVEYASKMQPRTIALVHGYAAPQEELRARLANVHGRAEIHCGPTEVAVT